jgi:hypothetical protein
LAKRQSRWQRAPAKSRELQDRALASNMLGARPCVHCSSSLSSLLDVEALIPPAQVMRRVQTRRAMRSGHPHVVRWRSRRFTRWIR